MSSKPAPKPVSNQKVKQFLDRYNKSGKLSLILSIIYIVPCYLSFLVLGDSAAEPDLFKTALYALFTLVIIPVSAILGLFGFIFACLKVKAKETDGMTYAALIIYGIAACFIIFEVLG